ncbi:MAG: hypothetical protein AB7T20_11645 [Steroidobacteraceae bacterium]
MTNQLTVRIDVENGIAVMSRSASARNLAVAAAAGSQAFAFTAAAQPLKPCDAEDDKNPIVYPEGVIIVAAVAGFVGAFAGGVVINFFRKK